MSPIVEQHKFQNYINSLLEWVEHDVDEQQIRSVLWAIATVNEDTTLLKIVKYERVEYARQMED